MEMSKRMVLCGVMVLVSRGTITQQMVGSAYILFYMLMEAQATPFQDIGDDLLASASNFALALISLSCVCFKFGAMSETLLQGGIVPADQLEDLIVDSTRLSYVLVGALFSALVVSSLVFFSQYQRERVRMKQEQKASKLRRLRYKEDQTEVDVPRIAKGNFHTFLSHVWATGQDEMRIVKQRLLEMMPDLRVFLDVDDVSQRQVSNTRIVLHAPNSL